MSVLRLPRPGPELRVFCLGAYYNRDARTRDRQQSPGSWEEYNLSRVLFAVKDHGKVERRGYTRRTIGGRTFKVGDRQTPAVNLQNALGLLLELLRPQTADLGERLGLVDPTIFVPVPSRDALVHGGDVERWGPRDLVRGLVKVEHRAELVRFTTPPKPASEGGPRDWHELIEHMALLEPPPAGTRSAVIVDDVLTSGGHMQAVAKLLLDAGIERVAGLCIAKTVSEPVADPWASSFVEIGPFGREG